MDERAFTSSICHTIIERVEQRPEIWRFKHPLYKKRFVHQKFWDELAAELGVNDKVLKRRWKHLKDQYRKELKRAVEKDDEDTVAWQYFRPLRFYREEIMHRHSERAVAAAIDADSAENSEEDGVPEAPPRSQQQPRPRQQPQAQPITTDQVHVINNKRDEHEKLDTILKRVNQTKNLFLKKMKALETRNNDPNYMFLLSLLPAMNQLSEVQTLQLKGKINNWLLEALAVKEYVNVCDDDSQYIPPVMEVIKYEED